MMFCKDCKFWKKCKGTDFVGECTRLTIVQGIYKDVAGTSTEPFFSVDTFGCVYFKDGRQFVVKNGSLWHGTKGFSIHAMSNVQNLANWLNEMWEDDEKDK